MPLRFPTTAETKDYKFNHTMLRVKDPKASLHFYTESEYIQAGAPE